VKINTSSFHVIPVFIAFTLFFNEGNGQPSSGLKTFTRADTLRGSITPEREWWDVLKYDITVEPDYNSKTIKGETSVLFKKNKEGSLMQIDLQDPLVIDSFFLVLHSETTKSKRWIPNSNNAITHNGNVWLITLPESLQLNSTATLTLFYHGKPLQAIRPPWDGGWIWTKDKSGRPWMTVACQGLGASVWFPCKDHQSDEPDLGASLTMTVPDTLSAIANGRLFEKKSNNDGTTSWTWQVKNPINNYNIIPYIGKYVNWHEEYNGEKGKLDCNYWVLDYNLDTAKKQFQQAKPMLKCFEHWFGPFPFYEDGFKLVETPHLGMEHQSAIAYGNGFQNGYRGRDLSQSGWGLKWDFILVHESGHEWFGNNITSNDIADMWVHESFTNYSETIFTTCEYGKEAGNDYVTGTRALIMNDIPIAGKYNVNDKGSGDMYYKGGNMIHMIRQIINNDEKFRLLLRGLNQAFYHKTVTTKQIEDYIIKQSGINFSKVFDQYLRTTQIPRLQYKLKGKLLQYRWVNCIKGFNMPVKINLGANEKWINPKTTWAKLNLPLPVNKLAVDRNFYIEKEEIR
jgi:aminopeptidase N